MMKAILLIVVLFSINVSPGCSRDNDFNQRTTEKITIESPQISIVGYVDTNYTDELIDKILSNESDLEKIFKNDKVIEKRPEKVGEIFVKWMRSKSIEEQKKIIEENVDKISSLLNQLDKKNSRIFKDVFDIIYGIFPVNPDVFDNLKPVAREVNERYNEKNKKEKRGDKKIEKDMYNNPVNKLMELTKDSEKKEGKEVEEKAQEISSSFEKNPSVQIGIAKLFLNKGNYKGAERYSTKAIEIDDKNYQAYTLRAQARYSLKDIRGAMEDVSKAMEIDPSNETTRLLSSFINKSPSFTKTDLNSIKDSFKDNRVEDQTFENQGKEVSLSSQSTLQKTNNDSTLLQQVSVEAKKSNFYLKNAMVKTQMGDYNESLKYLNMAINSNPDNLQAYLERANVYNLIGNYNEAIKDATYVLRNDPSNVDALNIRAWALYKSGNDSDAYNDTSRAIDLKPDFADAMFLRALIYEKQNKFNDMLKDLEKASRLNPNYVDKFRDALTNYAFRAPEFMKYYERNKDILKIASNEDERPFNLKRFLILLLFTVMGGIFIGVALLHVFSPKITTRTTTSSSISTQSDVITPNIFYEGVASGKYKIIKKIGQGGMGSVYLAIDQTLNREVAIKKMNEDLKMNEREKQRFIEEARTVAMLRHPNIIEIYTIFEERNDLYLVFEYIDGVSLDKKLDMEVRMPFYEVKEIINEISKALSYAHQKNVIHRDLKLSNIMISKEGFVKVMDFGLAKVVREAKARYSSKEIVGSPAYMAPEQDLGIFVKESDLYSLGVCIYEMLVGELPFNGPDYHYQKEKKLYTPITSIVVGLDKKLDDIVSKLLEPDPENRYHSIEEFLKDFNSLN